MNEKNIGVIFCSGWSFTESIFDRLITQLDLLPEQIIKTQWQLGIEKNLHFIKLEKHKQYILVGYSLGAFLLSQYLNEENVLGGIFCGLTASFIKTDLTPKGVEADVLSQMMVDLENEPGKTLLDFKNKCFSESKEVALKIEQIRDLEKLKQGLKYLTEVRVFPDSLGAKKVILFQGSRDQITSYSAVKAFSKMLNSELMVISGGDHGVLVTHSHLVSEKIKSLMA